MITLGVIPLAIGFPAKIIILIANGGIHTSATSPALTPSDAAEADHDVNRHKVRCWRWGFRRGCGPGRRRVQR